MRLFNRKNVFLYCVIYFLLTIAVSIYNLIRGQVYDYLGYYHEIYRAIFLFVVMAIVDFIKNFSLKKGLLHNLIDFWPLLLLLGLWLYLEYQRGGLPLEKLKQWLLYILVALLILLFITGIIASILKYFGSSKKVYFSLKGLLLILLLVLPYVVYVFIRGKSSVLYLLFKSNVYLIALVFLMMLFITFLLTYTLKLSYDLLTILFIIAYYICFIVMYFMGVNFYMVALTELCFFVSTIAYSIHNKLTSSIVLSLIYYVLILLGSILYFNPF